MKGTVLHRLPDFGLTPKRIWMYIFLTMAAAFFEGFGMAMFLPVLEYVEKGRDVAVLVAQGGIWDKLTKFFGFLGVDISLVSLLSVAVGLMIFRVLFMYARTIYTSWLSQEVVHVTRTGLFRAYLGMDYAAFSDHSSGSLVNTLLTESQRATGAFSALFGLISNVVVVFGFLCVLLWLSVPMTGLAFLFLAIAGAIVLYYVRHTRSISFATTDANAQLSRMLLERMGAFQLIKLSAVSSRESEVVFHASEDVRDHNYWLSKLLASVELILEPMVLLAGGGILYLAVLVFHMTLAQVGLFMLILLRLLPLAKEVLKLRQTWVACAGSMNAVLSGLDNALEAAESHGGQKEFAGLQQGIQLDDVSFTYPGESREALSNIDLCIPAGKTTALVGPSGAGKTTLADLVPRLRRPSKGRVLYDGVDGEEFELASLRRGMAIVSQDAAILDDTVAANLRFTCPEATEEQLWEALDRAQAAETVQAMPDGLATQLGEHGVRLSGGQKQRLSLARALLQQTSVLVLDEPTSALDSETERAIQQAMEDLRNEGRVTIIIIAHRLSTIRNADLIAVISDGVVLEQGTHDELKERGQWYSRASSMQSGDDFLGDV